MTTARHAARERALTLLYEAEQRSVGIDVVMSDLAVDPDRYALDLVAAVSDNKESIDGLIRGAAQGWSLERMPVVDRAVLRLAVAELMTRPDTPTAVVIDEAVQLAKDYSTADSGRFVNGVLATISRSLES